MWLGKDFTILIVKRIVAQEYNQTIVHFISTNTGVARFWGALVHTFIGGPPTETKK